jgi:benzoate/toluate 1,2-dioxygenase subunit beta
MKNDPASLPSHRSVEEFLFLQAELLDRRRFEDWMELFADDGVYWMPLSENQTDADSGPSIFLEDKPLMLARIGRLRDPAAYGQQPPSRTSHLIGNVMIAAGTGYPLSASPGEIVVTSRFAVSEFRRDVIRQFAGSYTHHLRRIGSGFAITMQRVDLINSDGLHEYNIQIYI